MLKNQTFDNTAEVELSTEEAINDRIDNKVKKATNATVNSRLVLSRLDFWCKNVE